MTPISLLTGMPREDEQPTGDAMTPGMQAFLGATDPNENAKLATESLRAVMNTPVAQADKDFEDSTKLQLPVSTVKELTPAMRQFLTSGDQESLQASGPATIDFVRRNPEVSQGRVSEMGWMEYLYRTVSDPLIAERIAEKQATTSATRGSVETRMLFSVLRGEPMADKDLLESQRLKETIEQQSAQLAPVSESKLGYAGKTVGQIAGYPTMKLALTTAVAGGVGLLIGGPPGAAAGAKLGGAVGLMDLVSHWWHDGSSAPVVGMAPGAVIAGPAGAAAGFAAGQMFEAEGGNAFADLREQKDTQGNKLPLEIAAVGGVTAGIINTAIEGITIKGLVSIGKSVPIVGKVFGGLGKAGVTQAVGVALRNPEVAKEAAKIVLKWQAGAVLEANQEFWQYFFPQVIKAVAKEQSDKLGTTKFNVESYLEEVKAAESWETIRDTFVGSVFLGGLPAGAAVYQTRKEAQQAQAAMGQLDQFRKAADESTLSPSAKKSWLQDLLVGMKEVWITGEEAKALYQTGNSKIAESLGLDPVAVEKASTQGDVIKIELSKLLVDLESPEYAKVAEVLKVSPGALSVKEANQVTSPEAMARSIQIAEDALKPDSDLNTAFADLETRMQESVKGSPNITADVVTTTLEGFRSFAVRQTLLGRIDDPASLAKKVVFGPPGQDGSIQMYVPSGPDVIRSPEGDVVLDQKFEDWFGGSYTRSPEGIPVQYAFDEAMMAPANDKTTGNRYYVLMKNPKIVTSETEVEDLQWNHSVPEEYVRQAAIVEKKDPKTAVNAYRKKDTNKAEVNRKIIETLKNSDPDLAFKLMSELQSTTSRTLAKEGFDGIKFGDRIHPTGGRGSMLLVNDDQTAMKEMAQRIVGNIRPGVSDQGAGPRMSDPQAGPPSFYQVHNLKEWEYLVREWMTANKYTKKQIDEHIKGMTGQMAVLTSVGKVKLDFFPRGFAYHRMELATELLFDPKLKRPKITAESKSGKRVSENRLAAAREEMKALGKDAPKMADFDLDEIMQLQNRDAWNKKKDRYPAIHAYLTGEAARLRPKYDKSAKNFGAIRSNQDKIYKVTLDVSAMCPRRLEMAATVRYIEELMQSDPAFKDRPNLTKDEVIALIVAFQYAGKIAPCMYCYVEGPRMKAVQFVQDFAETMWWDSPTEANAVLDEAFSTDKEGKKAVKKKKQWSDRTKSEWAAARAEAKKAKLQYDDVPLANWTDEEKINSQEDLSWRAKYPAISKFLDTAVGAAKANKPKMVENYLGEVLMLPEELVKELNGMAGFRIFSSSDFQIDHVFDIVQVMWDLNTRGLRAHAYTKVPAFVKIFGKTGVKIQCSVFAKKDPETGKLVEDTANGMPWADAQKFRKENPDVAVMLMATSDEIIEWGLDQNSLTDGTGDLQVDYIIPFHSSSGFEKGYWGEKGLGWTDYTKHQYEWKKGQEGGHDEALRMHELGVADGVSDEQMYKNYKKQLKERSRNRPVFVEVKLKNGKSVETHKHYMKLKKDYGRTDTPFNVPDPTKIDLDAALDVVKQVEKGLAPKSEPDKPFGKNFLKAVLEGQKRGISLGEKATADRKAPFMTEEGRFSLKQTGTLRKTNPDVFNKIEKEEKITVYRAMQLIDGKLYPPMSAIVGGKLREPSEIGEWEVAAENPELADDKGYFKLNKGNKKTIQARYNPYFHTSRTPLNDQFSEAYNRPNLVTVEVQVPKSELTSGYKAPKAKDSVGEMSWNSGPVSRKLPKNKARRVILSRYTKILRIVPDSEVADHVAKLLEGEGITVPGNVVTPSLRDELIKRGVKVGEPPMKKGADNPNILKQFGKENRARAHYIDGTLGFPDQASIKVAAIDFDSMPADALLGKLGLRKTPRMPWEMTREEFDTEEAKGMGVSWYNAVQTETGEIKLSGTREHGDMIGTLEEEFDGPFTRGWTWGKDKSTFITEKDVNATPDASFYETYRRIAKEKGLTEKPASLASFLSSKGKSFVTKSEVLSFLETEAKKQEQPSLYQPDSQEMLGAVTPLPDQYLVTFFRGANASTVIHEMSHIFLLEMQAWIKAKGIKGMDAEFQKDWASLCEWLKVDPATFDHTNSAQHEQFARAFEKYAREGKAPSTDLIPAFAKYRTWLTDVYKKVTDIDFEAQQEINLTPGVRSFFDRMLATEQEIQIASTRLSIGFSDRELNLMSIPEYDKDYLRRLHKKALEAGREKLHAQRAKNRNRRLLEEKKIVADLAEREPVYLARKDLRMTGLDAGMLEAEFGAETRKALSKQHLVKDGTGRSVGQTAIDHGYQNEQDFIDDLLTAPSKKDWIRNELGKRMAEYDKQYDAEADILNTAEAQEYLRAVSGYLEQHVSPGRAVSMQEKMIRHEAVKRAVEAKLSTMPLTEAMQTDRFMVQFRSQTRKTREAVAKKDFQAALQANQKARFLFEAVRQSRKLRNEITKRERGFKKALDSKTIDPNYKTAMVNLGRDFGLTTRSMDPSGRLSLIDLLRPVIDPENAPWLIPPAFSDFLFTLPAGKTSQPKYTSLQTKQARELFDALLFLEKKGRKVLTGSLDGTKLKLDDILAKLMGPLQKLPDRNLAVEESLTRMAQDFAAGYLAPSEVLQYTFKSADGSVENGPHTELIWDPIGMGWSKKAGRLRDIRGKLDPILARIDARAKQVDLSKLPVPYLFRTQNMKWTWQRVIGLALHMGNGYNAAAVVSGYELEAGELQQIVALLTEQDWKDVQSIWDTVNSLWPDLKKAYERINVLAPGKVVGDPITVKTADGKKLDLAGGYFPLKFDGRLVLRVGEWDERSDFLAQVQASFPTPNVPSGYMKERTSTGGLPPSLDFGGVMATHLDMATTYIYLADVLGDSDRILRGSMLTDDQKAKLEDPTFRPTGELESQADRAARSYPATFMAKFTAPLYKQFRPWLARIANGKSNVAQTTFDRMASSISAMGAAQALAGRPATAVKQVFGAVGFINDPEGGLWKYLDGLSTCVFNPWEIYEINKLSPGVMDKRWNSFDPSLDEVLRASGIEKYYGAEALEGVRKATMIPMNIVDSLTTYPTWISTYRSEMEKHGNSAKAVQKADSIVVKHQPSNRPMDLVGYQRDARGVASWFFMFGGWLFKFGTKQIYNVRGLSQGTLSGSDAVRFSAIEWLLPVIGTKLLLACLRSGPKPPPPPDKETVKDLAFDAFASLVGPFPVLGSMAQLAVKKASGRPFSDFDTPATQAMNNLVDGIAGVFDAMAEPGSSAKFKAAAWAFAEMASVVLRVPATRMYSDFMKGYEQAQSTGEWGRLLFPGRK